LESFTGVASGSLRTIAPSQSKKSTSLEQLKAIACLS
jgi:hypothetical protein